jgi:hypothetical protein
LRIFVSFFFFKYTFNFFAISFKCLAYLKSLSFGKISSYQFFDSWQLILSLTLGKRQQTSSPLRWGKRSGDERQEPLRWGKRQAQPPLRWGKRLANVWAPSWTPKKDTALERMIDLHESTTPIEDFGFQESTAPTYSWGTKFPIR